MLLVGFEHCWHALLCVFEQLGGFCHHGNLCLSLLLHPFFFGFMLHATLGGYNINLLHEILLLNSINYATIIVHHLLKRMCWETLFVFRWGGFACVIRGKRIALLGLGRYNVPCCFLLIKDNYE